jgi:hypothetical protein
MNMVKATRDFAQRYAGYAGCPEGPKAKKMVFPMSFVFSPMYFHCGTKLPCNYSLH